MKLQIVVVGILSAVAFLSSTSYAGEGKECDQQKQALKETADSVIAQHLKALGGVEKLKAAKTFQFTATTYEGDSITKMTARRSRPNLMRYDIQKGDKTIVKAFDGTNGWVAEGNAAPKALEKDKQPKMAEKAAFDDVLVDYAKRGVKVELAGIVDVKGAPAYKLVLTRGEGVEARLLDKQTMLEVKRVVSYTHEGKKVTKVVHFSDYRSVDGIMVNHLTEWEGEGGVKGKTVIESANYGAPIDAAAYRMSAPRS
ncbi:MAG TPA: hypothetical protein VNA24_04355 [Hyalangium sp.]|jgi:hypothetical protein|nr:hypothetical protein [Hyalangium sp.]